MTNGHNDVKKLVEHYNNLLGLYSQLETVSADFFEALTDSSLLGTVQSKLKEKLVIVELIQEESKKIADLKNKIRLSEGERVEVRKVEEKLTTAVNQIVEQEDRGRELFQKQGVKISRK